jgi:hypothetical protein
MPAGGLSPELKAAAAKLLETFPSPPPELLIPLRPAAAIAFAAIERQQAEARAEQAGAA